MIVIFLGAPGAGKGTQAQMLKERFNFSHISMGDILRERVMVCDELSREIATYMAKGELVPDSIILTIVKDYIKEGKVILDGFPRNVVQAKALDELLSSMNRELKAVVYFDISKEELLERLCGRRICSRCNRNYHIKFAPPKVADLCDYCAIPLSLRKDDKEEIVLERYLEYERKTKPLLAYYKERGILYSISAQESIKQINKRLEALILDELKFS